MSRGGDNESGRCLAHAERTREFRVIGDVYFPVRHNAGVSNDGSLQNTPHRIAVGAKRARELQKSEPCALVHKLWWNIRRERVGLVPVHPPLCVLPGKAEQRCDKKQRGQDDDNLQRVHQASQCRRSGRRRAER